VHFSIAKYGVFPQFGLGGGGGTVSDCLWLASVELLLLLLLLLLIMMMMVVVVVMMSQILLFVAYALVLVCALAFVTNLLRCLKFLVSSANVELTVEQQRLFGVTDFGWCCVNCSCQFLTESGFRRVLKHRQFVSFSLFCDFLSIVLGLI